jgi:hypothetical protein
MASKQTSRPLNVYQIYERFRFCGKKNQLFPVARNFAHIEVYKTETNSGYYGWRAAMVCRAGLVNTLHWGRHPQTRGTVQSSYALTEDIHVGALLTF